MDREKLLQLIKKVINGSASRKEEEEVNNELFDPFSSNGWDQRKMGERSKVQDKIVNNILDGLGKTKGRSETRRLVIRLGTIAASIFLFSMIAFYGVRFMSGQEPTEIERLASSLPPGKEKASLTLNDGTILALEDISVGESFEGPGFVVVKTKEGNLEYRYHDGLLNDSSNDEWNVLSTPLGGKFQIVLADGTKVWLNAESSLAFPKSFSGDARRVKVTGEVYFEVSHNENKPFIVKTEAMDIQVLGTSFNVSTYADNPYPMVSLIEGAVQVQTETSLLELIPGQRASIENHQINVGLFDIESEIAWKNDYFLFKNKNIKEIMSALARWYGAEVEYQGENWSDKNYTIRISRRENIGEILSLIELMESVKFKIEGRRIIVVT